ncbi:MAG: hypothetical protein ABI921_00375 [Panacibacter sp.]
MRFTFLITAFFCVSFASGQTIQADSLNYVNALKNAKTLYRQFVDPPTGLYNGGEYVEYAYQIKEGDPFFAPDFKTGSVLYDGILYNNVPLLYDIFKESVVIKDPFEIYKLVLINERLSEFTIQDHRFIKLIGNDSNRSVISTGYYEVLYDGAIHVYRQEKKKMQENVTFTEGIKRYIVETNFYFIEKDNTLYPVNKKKSLLSALVNKKSEVQQFMRKNKLNLRKDKIGTLTKVAAYYDEINK